MGISLKTHKMLWGRSGNRCAMEDCKIELVMDITETDDESLIGEECHIVAQKQDGPRGDIDFDEDKINTYNNLVLLCRNHHKVVDDHPTVYTIGKLLEIKENHEKWIKTKLELFDYQKQKDDEVYATYIDTWIELSDLNHWKGWSSFVLGAEEPHLAADMYNNLEKLKDWMFNRIWPERYNELEKAFENFRVILQDFLNTFKENSKKTNDWYYTEKFYNRRWHDDEEVYNRLFRQYMFHVFLVEDLIIELTRAANYVCNMIREYIDSSFRLREGMVTIEIGPFMDLTYRQYKVQYLSSDLMEDNFFYKGIEDFKERRLKRDYCRGVGIDENDERFIKFLYS